LSYINTKSLLLKLFTEILIKADVAQLVEQLICNQLVGGSSPSIGSSSLSYYPGGYQSGQMGQTVNLLAKPSEVRILLPPLHECGSSSFGRAIAFQAIGGGFEPRLPLVKNIKRLSVEYPIYLGDFVDPKSIKSLCSSEVEHFLGKEGVRSSTLLKGSKI
jgi:hypothetical protein